MKSFSLLIYSLLLFAGEVSVFAAPNCSSQQFDEISKIRYVHDGDTLHLVDGRKVRLIGINAPELEHDETPAQPFADAAREALRSLFSKDKTVALIYGKDIKDRYGRILAHAFLADGKNVQAILLQQGVANAINVPPNTRFSSCYLEMENSARCNADGLWQSRVILEAKNLSRQDAGFHLVQGRVESIVTTTQGIWLNIDNSLTVGIRPDDLPEFDVSSLNDYINQTVIVRGWVNKSHRETPYYLRLRHPLSLQLASALSCAQE